MAYDRIFPTKLKPIASALLPRLESDEESAAVDAFIVRVDREQLSIPGRVYYAPMILRSVISKSEGAMQALALCLGTRHCDGFIREECVRRLIEVDEPWVVPFVVQLTGEYVVEIADFVAASLARVNKKNFGEFVRENPEFMATTKRRAISYWNCYYRGHFPSLEAYPGVKALNAISQMT